MMILYYNNFLLMSTLFFLDNPDPPTDLTLALLPVKQSTLSWTPPFTPFASPEVTLSYFVNVTNLNTSQVFRFGELDTLSFNFSFNFSLKDSSPCDVYQFTVTARNAAGWSDPSDTLTASLPSCRIFTYLHIYIALTYTTH